MLPSSNVAQSSQGKSSALCDRSKFGKGGNITMGNKPHRYVVLVNDPNRSDAFFNFHQLTVLYAY
jgi:hypothetical protein